MKYCILPFVFAMMTARTLVAQKVDLKTGNFSVKHEDHKFFGGYEASIARVYNSTAAYKSIFGWGWSFDLSKELIVNPDGSIVTKECECEGRTNNFFKPISFDETARSAAIEKIVTALQEKRGISSEELFNIKNRLVKDRDFFIEEWQKLVSLGLMQPYEVPVGTKLVSKYFSFEVITKTAEGYTLESVGRKKYYSPQGRLLRIQEGSSFLEAGYEAGDRLASLRDRIGNEYRFFYNDGGLVERIVARGTHNDTMLYRYENDELVEVRNGKGSIRYAYSRDGKHSLLSYRTDDEELVRLRYAVDGYGRVAEFRNLSEGDSTVYRYAGGELGGTEYLREGASLTYANRVEDEEDEDEDEDSVGEEDEAQSAEGWSLSREEAYKFYFIPLEDGFQYNYRTLWTRDGDTEDTYNNEEGFPDRIVTATDTIHFTYNAFGEVTLKESRGKKEEVEYDPVSGRISFYRRSLKFVTHVSWKRFTYNDAGNLIRAEDSEDNRISMEYDGNGNIVVLRNEGLQKEIEILYNAQFKPIELRMKGMGSLFVEYDEELNVSSVRTEPEDRNLAMELSGQMQALLELTNMDNLKPCKCSN